jgi:hypothetical protein
MAIITKILGCATAMKDVTQPYKAIIIGGVLGFSLGYVSPTSGSRHILRFRAPDPRHRKQRECDDARHSLDLKYIISPPKRSFRSRRSSHRISAGPEDFATASAATGAPITGGGAPATLPVAGAPATSGPLIIPINGDNPATVSVGA